MRSSISTSAVGDLAVAEAREVESGELLHRLGVRNVPEPRVPAGSGPSRGEPALA